MIGFSDIVSAVHAALAIHLQSVLVLGNNYAEQEGYQPTAIMPKVETIQQELVTGTGGVKPDLTGFR